MEPHDTTVPRPVTSCLEQCLSLVICIASHSETCLNGITAQWDCGSFLTFFFFDKNVYITLSLLLCRSVRRNPSLFLLLVKTYWGLTVVILVFGSNGDRIQSPRLHLTLRNVYMVQNVLWSDLTLTSLQLEKVENAHDHIAFVLYMLIHPGVLATESLDVEYPFTHNFWIYYRLLLNLL